MSQNCHDSIGNLLVPRIHALYAKSTPNNFFTLALRDNSTRMIICRRQNTKWLLFKCKYSRMSEFMGGNPGYVPSRVFINGVPVGGVGTYRGLKGIPWREKKWISIRTLRILKQ